MHADGAAGCLEIVEMQKNKRKAGEHRFY